MGFGLHYCCGGFVGLCLELLVYLGFVCFFGVVMFAWFCCLWWVCCIVCLLRFVVSVLVCGDGCGAFVICL